MSYIHTTYFFLLKLANQMTLLNRLHSSDAVSNINETVILVESITPKACEILPFQHVTKHGTSYKLLFM